MTALPAHAQTSDNNTGGNNTNDVSESIVIDLSTTNLGISNVGTETDPVILPADDRLSITNRANMATITARLKLVSMSNSINQQPTIQPAEFTLAPGELQNISISSIINATTCPTETVFTYEVEVISSSITLTDVFAQSFTYRVGCI